MQFVIPKEARTRLLRVNAIRVILRFTMVVVSGHIRRSIEQLVRIGNEVVKEAMDVENGKARAGPSVLDQEVRGSAVAEHGIDAGGVLVDLVLVLQDVVGGLVLPELTVESTAKLGEVVQRKLLERNDVEKDKVASASLVHAVEDAKDAVNEARERSTRLVIVTQEGTEAEVVGADPESIDGVISRPVAVELVELQVSLEGGDLIVRDRRERLANEREISLDDGVGASGAADGVVEGLGARLFGDEMRPSIAAAGGVGACREELASGGRLAVVADEVAETAFVGVAVTKGDEVLELFEAASGCGRQWHQGSGNG